MFSTSIKKQTNKNLKYIWIGDTGSSCEVVLGITSSNKFVNSNLYNNIDN